MKEPSFLDILRSRMYTDKQKRIAVEKFKWNHLPEWYRERNKEEIKNKLLAIQNS